MRHGQWVLFDWPDNAQLVAEDKKFVVDKASVDAVKSKACKSGGKFVGIYQRGGIDPISKKLVSGRVVPVKKKTGENIRCVIGEDDRAVTVMVLAVDVKVEAVTQRKQVPAGRLQTMDPKWKPSR